MEPPTTSQPSPSRQMGPWSRWAPLRACRPVRPGSWPGKSGRAGAVFVAPFIKKHGPSGAGVPDICPEGLCHRQTHCTGKFDIHSDILYSFRMKATAANPDEAGLLNLLRQRDEMAFTRLIE